MPYSVPRRGVRLSRTDSNSSMASGSSINPLRDQSPRLLTAITANAIARRSTQPDEDARTKGKEEGGRGMDEVAGSPSVSGMPTPPNSHGYDVLRQGPSSPGPSMQPNRQTSHSHSLTDGLLTPTGFRSREKRVRESPSISTSVSKRRLTTRAVATQRVSYSSRRLGDESPSQYRSPITTSALQRPSINNGQTSDDDDDEAHTRDRIVLLPTRRVRDHSASQLMQDASTMSDVGHLPKSTLRTLFADESHLPRVDEENQEGEQGGVENEGIDWQDDDVRASLPSVTSEQEEGKGESSLDRWEAPLVSPKKHVYDQPLSPSKSRQAHSGMPRPMESTPYRMTRKMEARKSTASEREDRIRKTIAALGSPYGAQRVRREHDMLAEAQGSPLSNLGVGASFSPTSREAIGREPVDEQTQSHDSTLANLLVQHRLGKANAAQGDFQPGRELDLSTVLAQEQDDDDEDDEDLSHFTIEPSRAAERTVTIDQDTQAREPARWRGESSEEIDVNDFVYETVVMSEDYVQDQQTQVAGPNVEDEERGGESTAEDDGEGSDAEEEEGQEEGEEQEVESEADMQIEELELGEVSEVEESDEEADAEEEQPQPSAEMQSDEEYGSGRSTSDEVEEESDIATAEPLRESPSLEEGEGESDGEEEEEELEEGEEGSETSGGQGLDVVDEAQLSDVAGWDEALEEESRYQALEEESRASVSVHALEEESEDDSSDALAGGDEEAEEEDERVGQEADGYGEDIYSETRDGQHDGALLDQRLHGDPEGEETDAEDQSEEEVQSAAYGQERTVEPFVGQMDADQSMPPPRRIMVKAATCQSGHQSSHSSRGSTPIFQHSKYNPDADMRIDWEEAQKRKQHPVDAPMHSIQLQESAANHQGNDAREGVRTEGEGLASTMASVDDRHDNEASTTASNSTRDRAMMLKSRSGIVEVSSLSRAAAAKVAESLKMHRNYNHVATLVSELEEEEEDVTGHHSGHRSFHNLDRRDHLIEISSLNRDAAVRAAEEILNLDQGFTIVSEFEDFDEDHSCLRSFNGLQETTVRIRLPGHSRRMPKQTRTEGQALLNRLRPSPSHSQPFSPPRTPSTLAPVIATPTTPWLPGAFPKGAPSSHTSKHTPKPDRARAAVLQRLPRPAQVHEDVFCTDSWRGLNALVKEKIITSARLLRASSGMEKSQALLEATAELDRGAVVDEFMEWCKVQRGRGDWSKASMDRKVLSLLHSFLQHLQQGYPRLDVDATRSSVGLVSDEPGQGPSMVPSLLAVAKARKDTDESGLAEASSVHVPFEMPLESTPARTRAASAVPRRAGSQSVNIYPRLPSPVSTATMQRETLPSDARGQEASVGEDTTVGLLELASKSLGYVFAKVGFHKAGDGDGKQAKKQSQTSVRLDPPSTSVSYRPATLEHHRLSRPSTTLASSSDQSHSMHYYRSGSSRLIQGGASSSVDPTALCLLSPHTHAQAKTKVQLFRQSREARRWRSPRASRANVDTSNTSTSRSR